MYVVGFLFNADGYMVPVAADSLEAGVSKNIYGDNGSCGYVVFDGFKDLELVAFDLTSEREKEYLSTAIAPAVASFCEGYSLVLAFKSSEDGMMRLVGFEDFEPETGDIFELPAGATGNKMKADFLYTEGDSDGDDDIDEYMSLISYWN